MTAPRLPLRTTRAGFTLVEVLVALFIMAILASMAWQGIDGLIRTRDGAQSSTESSLRLGTVLAQWEQDLNQVQPGPAAPALKFDGAALRLTRRSVGGVQLVMWTRQDNALYRWASPPVTRASELQEWWIRSQQWAAVRADALLMLPELSAWQVYFFQKGDNNWSNAQSSGNVNSPAPPPPPASGASAPNRPEDDEEAVPIGVRLLLTLPAGPLTRDVLVRPSA